MDFEELDYVSAAAETVCESETVDDEKPLANGQTVVVAHATLSHLFGNSMTLHPLRSIKGHGSPRTQKKHSSA